MSSELLPSFKSSSVAALKAPVESANWVGNLLWLSLAALTSSFFIGYIAVFGYATEVLQRRCGRPENPNIDIDPDRLGDYITKGIWPFVGYIIVQFVGGMLMLPVIAVPVIIVMAAAAAENGAVLALGIIMVILVSIAMSVVIYLFAVPVMIRAMITQDFAAMFDFQWSKNFVKMMAGEMIPSGIVFSLLSCIIIFIGELMLCIGVLPAGGIVMGGAAYLMAQWYEIYLSRGGEPCPGPGSPGSSPDEVVEATIV